MADSSVAITAGAGTPIRVLTALGAGSAGQQVITLADSAGNLLGTTAAPVPVTGSGTAGTPAAGVQTVQGIAGGTPQPVLPQPATLLVTATGAASAAVTVTLPAVAAQFHYITSIKVQRYAAAALTGAAAPVLVTSTNLPGSPVWTVDTVGAIGTSVIQQDNFGGSPLRSSTVNTATTIVAPVYTNAIWRISVSYYTAA